MNPVLFLSKRFFAMKVMQRLSWAGIVFSVASLLVTLGVAQGFENEFKKALLNFHAHISVLPDEREPLSKEELERAFQKTGSKGAIFSIQPYLYREALLIHQGVMKGVVLKGIPMEAHDGVVVGKALAEKTGSGTNEMVRFLIPKGKEISAKDTVRLKVAGIFKSGIYELDDQFVLLDLKTLQKLFGLGPKVYGYEIKLKDPDDAPQVAKRLKENLNPSYLIQDWSELNQPLLEAFRLEKWFFRILIGFMVAVSVLNLMGVILLNIFRKKKTITILRALGLRSRQVQLLFALEGFYLGLLGVVSGLILGFSLMITLRYFHWVPIDPEVYFLEKLPMAFQGSDILAVNLLSLLLVVIFSWVVARQTAAVSIREGLHGPG